LRHNLKIEARWLSLIRAGSKRAEIRRADRSFSAGDELLLYLPDMSEAELVTVTHVLRLAEVPGIPEDLDFVSLSIQDVESFRGVDVLRQLEQNRSD